MTNAHTPDHTEYGFGITLAISFDEAVDRVTAALKAQGFGVLTTIDVRQTMREKLDVNIEPYVILGACNPQLAYRGIKAEPQLGLLLPCNVIVRRVASKTVVTIVDPVAMLEIVGDNSEVRAIAQEAAEGLRLVVDALHKNAEGPSSNSVVGH